MKNDSISVWGQFVGGGFGHFVKDCGRYLAGDGR